MDTPSGNGNPSSAPTGGATAAEHVPEPSGRYSSLQDYLRVLRRRKLLIALAIVVSLGVALALTATKEQRYEAVASVLVRDLSQDLTYLSRGGSSRLELPPNIRSAVSADQVLSPRVARVAAKQLDGDVTPQAMLARVSTRVEVTTNLVQIVGAGPSAPGAAATANAFAIAARRVLPGAIDRKLQEAERLLAVAARRARRLRPTSARSEHLSLQRNQIAVLRRIHQPVQIVDHAQPPSRPVSPNLGRAGTIGALIGLMLGLVGAFGRDALDRRLHNAREVHEELGLPVLGRISDATFASPGLVGNGLPMLDSDFEAFRVLRANLAFSADGGPPSTVLVTSGLPEEGKSTVSISLACASALAGQRTLLVEADLRRPSFARRFGIQSGPGLAEYLDGTASPQKILQVVDLIMPVGTNGSSVAEPTPAGEKLIVIAAGTSTTGAAELLTTQRFTDFVAKVGKAYDLVVIDAGPVLAVVDPMEIMSHVDLVLVCARVQRTTRDEAHAIRAALEHIPAKPMGAVVTGIRRGDLDDYYYEY